MIKKTVSSMPNYVGFALEVYLPWCLLKFPQIALSHNFVSSTQSLLAT